MARESSRRDLVFGWVRLDPDHEAAIRFKGEAPGRRAHSVGGLATMAHLVTPPPRIVISGLVRMRDRSPKLCLFAAHDQADASCRNSTPTGTTPVLAMRQSAISSFRARPTIMVVLRAPLGPSVRARYHRASALFFWNLRNRQASWISPRRTRLLPDLASPFSRRLDPLSSGVPVKPT